jgi:hypothetical protein
MAKIIRVDGSEEIIDKEKLTLEFMQEIVEGYIQIVPMGFDAYMVCNEEGKLKHLPVNITATKIWAVFYGNTDIITGNVIFANKEEID